MVPVTTALADALEAHRARHGLSQKALAARLGVSQNAVLRWENGGNVSAVNTPSLAKELGIDPADIAKMSFTGGDDDGDIETRLLAPASPQRGACRTGRHPPRSDGSAHRTD